MNGTCRCGAEFEAYGAFLTHYLETWPDSLRDRPTLPGGLPGEYNPPLSYGERRELRSHLATHFPRFAVVRELGLRPPESAAGGA